MRKLIAVGLLVGGLLAMAGPAMAQQGGLGDPLTLAASGVLMPFFGDPGDVALLEVASPVGDNSGVHMFFFDANCNRVGDSVFLPLTVNDIAFLQVVGSVDAPGVLDTFGFFSGVSPTDGGLITIANSDDGFTLDPLKNPIHSRMYLFNPSTGRSRIVEPIILDTFEYSGDPHTWSPLRTAATFFAPQENAPISTRLWLICPRDTIQDTGYFTTSLFPGITPQFFDHFGSSDDLRAVVFDTDEHPLRDVHTPCDCVRSVGTIDPGISTIYSDPLAKDGTFTKITTNPASPSHEFPFTGYRSVSTGPVNDFFGRLSNGSYLTIDGRNPTGVVSNTR